MKCPICSAKIGETDAFCPNCGSAVKSETSGYMDSIDTSNLGENAGFGRRNTSGARPVNSAAQENYAQGQRSYGQPQNGSAQQSYPPPQNGYAQTPYGSAYEPYKIAPVTSVKKGIPKPLMSVIVFILAFLVAFGVRYFYKNTATKTLEGTGYTMTGPADIQKSSSKNLYALDNFSNNEVGINAVKLSYSDVAIYGYGKGESASDIFDFILDNGSTTLKVTGKDSKYIYYTQSIGDKHYYGMSSMTEGNGGYYIFDFLCEQKNKSKYEDKFKDWAASVEIK